MVRVPQYLIPIFEEMLYEFLENRLEVILIPGQKHTEDGGMIRVANSKNVDWYSELCSYNLSNRNKKRTGKKVDTKIKRRRVEATLRCIINKGWTKSGHSEFLLDVAQTRFNLYERASMSSYSGQELIPFDNQF